MIEGVIEVKEEAVLGEEDEAVTEIHIIKSQRQIKSTGSDPVLEKSQSLVFYFQNVTLMP